MPRTKVSRKVLQKRTKRDSNEEKREMMLRELEEMAEEYESTLEQQYQEALNTVTTLFDEMKAKIPKSVMKMTVRELRESNHAKINDLTIFSNQGLNALNGTMVSDISTVASLSIMGDKLRVKDSRLRESKRSQQDEEEGTVSNRSSGVGSYKSSHSGTSAKAGPLLSSSRFNLRRSKSVEQVATPGVRPLAPSTSRARGTPLAGTLSSGMSVHASRSKYKTPLNARPLSKAVSADRLLITPKCQPTDSMAILRRAHLGEKVFSLTGSPVISAGASEDVANVNIPVANGVLSLRPTHMGVVDAQVLNKLDLSTIEQLKTLQLNLNKLMAAAERQHFNIKH